MPTYCYHCNSGHNHIHSPTYCPDFPYGCNYCDEEEAQRMIDYWSGLVPSLQYSFEVIAYNAEAGAEQARSDGEEGEASLLDKIRHGAWHAAKGIGAAALATSKKVGSLASKGLGWMLAIESFVKLEAEYWEDLAEFLYRECRGCGFHITRWQVDKGAHGWVTCKAPRTDKSTPCNTKFRFCYRIKIGKPWCPNYDKHERSP